ncbi:SlyX family protein [Mucilaginibacter flavidus]|uniref:SlyX family protein n=1 Tax=Mucilaginibacter flavidus TaxID=2949309 RepID=UPI0020920580|nr:SlyX family protein [Mucilaginibacter flavidus]MCO5949828.1 SlyX family protein [Mucilaginibacter flavidus]
MKTFLTTAFAILLFTVTCCAQWTAGTGIITTTNSVGIGTTTPSAKLHVVSAEVRLTGIGTTGIASSGVYSVYDSNNTTRVGYFGDASAGNSDMYLRADVGALNFSTSSGSMYLGTTGNFGIGTVAPIAKLSVAVNTTATDGLFIQNSSNTTYGTFMAAGSAGGGFSNWANSMVLESVPVSTGGFVLSSYTGNITFQTSSRTNRMTITSAGNVGIGTTTPDQALSVNGTVHSKAVVVDNSIFPDYVFNKTYALRPLSAVKTYIDLNHHLPEMPSAAEVAKNGQNLGEINTLLLKKVEELTLYMIEKDKQVKALEQQNEILVQQQAEIDQLKKQVKELLNNKN